MILPRRSGIKPCRKPRHIKILSGHIQRFFYSAKVQRAGTAALPKDVCRKDLRRQAAQILFLPCKARDRQLPRDLRKSRRIQTVQKVSRERETLFARIEVEPELINIYGKKSVENLLITLFEKLQN